jgi:D-alanyl-D-alanine carboxypeptidase
MTITTTARGPLLFAAFASALVAGGTYVARDLDAPPVTATPQARPATPTSELVRAHPDHDGGGSASVQAGGGGALPDGASPFDLDLAGIAHLDPDLLAALQEASRDAADDGVEVVVNSGWRSAAYQQRLLDEAVATYGSRAEAARWVATPATSSHVSGDAVDIGPKEAAGWLDEHGARYGLCRTYRNEAWHFELCPEARDDGCPAPYADPTDDPRMQR